MRQFDVEIPVQDVRDAEAIMDLFAFKLQHLFEQLGKGEELDYQSIRHEADEENRTGAGREGADVEHRPPEIDAEAPTE